MCVWVVGPKEEEREIQLVVLRQSTEGGKRVWERARGYESVAATVRGCGCGKAIVMTGWVDERNSRLAASSSLLYCCREP